jgi:hypothetical protein
MITLGENTILKICCKGTLKIKKKIYNFTLIDDGVQYIEWDNDKPLDYEKWNDKIIDKYLEVEYYNNL